MKKISYFFLACGLLVLASCNKEDVKPEKANQTTIMTRAAVSDYDRLAPYASMTHIRKNRESLRFYDHVMAGMTQTFSVSANREINVTGDKGTMLRLPANSLIYPDGSAVVGMIDIELVEVFDKGSMVLLDKGTSGYNPSTGAIDALVSGGEIYVRASQGGTELTLTTPMSVVVETATLDPAMQKFTELDGTGDNLLWEETGEDIAFEAGGGRGQYAFEILPGEWGWTNIDRWAGDPCAKTSIFVEVPSGYNPANTEVYLSYDGEPGQLANFDMWTGTRFTEHYGQICIGLNVHFIAVTNIGGSLKYAIHPAVIVSGHVEVFTSFTPISEAALIALINGLP